MGQQSKAVTFDLMCPQSRVWLVLTSADREPQVIEMRQRRGMIWSASANLPPGEYRCRYYSGDDKKISYYGPATAEGCIDCGMDALLTVTIPEEKSASAISPVSVQC
jgi:hypothetical protein